MPSDYRLIIQPGAERDMRALPNADLRRMMSRIHRLASDPRPPGNRKLEGDVFRVRQGNYRIIYEVDDENPTVTIFKVGHRREVYRR